MKYDVFISYAQNDRNIVEKICDNLEAYGVSYVVAYRDFPNGTKQAISTIHNSRLMLVIFSKEYNESKDTDNEIALASDYGIPILVFRITEDNLNCNKNYYLTTKKWIDAFPEPERQFEELYRTISIMLDNKNI